MQPAYNAAPVPEQAFKGAVLFGKFGEKSIKGKGIGPVVGNAELPSAFDSTVLLQKGKPEHLNQQSHSMESPLPVKGKDGSHFMVQPMAAPHEDTISCTSSAAFFKGKGQESGNLQSSGTFDLTVLKGKGQSISNQTTVQYAKGVFDISVFKGKGISSSNQTTVQSAKGAFDLSALKGKGISSTNQVTVQPSVPLDISVFKGKGISSKNQVTVQPSVPLDLTALKGKGLSNTNQSTMQQTPYQPPLVSNNWNTAGSVPETDTASYTQTQSEYPSHTPTPATTNWNGWNATPVVGTTDATHNSWNATDPTQATDTTNNISNTEMSAALPLDHNNVLAHADPEDRQQVDAATSSSQNHNMNEVELTEYRQKLGVQFLRPYNNVKPIESFDEQEDIPEFVRIKLKEEGKEKPFPIQSQVIPLASLGYNITGIAKTGSGKTLAFLLPMMKLCVNEKTCQALCLTPTRELAQQTLEQMETLTRIDGMRTGKKWRDFQFVSTVVFGGVNKRDQKWNAYNAAFIAATTGRLIDFVTEPGPCIKLDAVKYFILDEADAMVDGGFLEDVHKICTFFKERPQMLYFSATWPKHIQDLSVKLLSDVAKQGPHCFISVNTQSSEKPTVNKKITQTVHVFDTDRKYSGWDRHDETKLKILEEYLHNLFSPEATHKIPPKVIIFVSTKVLAQKIADNLWEKGIYADSIHGDKKQENRLKVLESFRQGRCRVMVATDVVGRGIDIPYCTHVIIFHMPADMETYVHRIGRTARGKDTDGSDASGEAVAYFDYYYGAPDMAKHFIEVLEDADQTIPDGLKVIADEVQKYGADRVEGGATTSGGNWKSNNWKNGWKSGEWKDWSNNNRKNDDKAQEETQPSTSTTTVTKTGWDSPIQHDNGWKEWRRDPSPMPTATGSGSDNKYHNKRYTERKRDRGHSHDSRNSRFRSR